MVPDKKSEEFMKTLFIVTLIVLAVLIVLSIVLAIIGKKAIIPPDWAFPASAKAFEIKNTFDFQSKTKLCSVYHSS